MPSGTEFVDIFCPSWCSGDHEGQDHAQDRYHFSPQVLVPVVTTERGTRPGAEATEFAVLASQPVGQATDIWVAVVGERQFIEVTVESAVRLHVALGALIDQLRGTS
ncbi:DUF6907 domain-containing protein [Microbacterium sp. B24]|uniref:DUF6907 domain-containing protein n=1 Tax=Microbacterium sp. B24 TaxID=95616 RepID=UPI0035B53F7A